MLVPEKFMITDPATALKREVLQLIDLQIETLKQESSLDHSQLQDYRTRSEKIRKLFSELDQSGERGPLSSRPNSFQAIKEAEAAT
jgi:hypothetical protein